MLENVTFCTVDKLVNLCFINFNTAPTHTALKRFVMAPFVSEPAAVTKLVEPLNNILSLKVWKDWVFCLTG